MMKIQLLSKDFWRHKRFLLSLLFLNFFSFFALYLVIGFEELIQERFRSESKLLLGSDIEFSARRVFSKQEEASITESMKGLYEKTSDQIIMLSNVTYKGNGPLYNVKWIGQDLPFYQKMKFSAGSKAWATIHQEPSIFLYVESKQALGVNIGDPVTVMGRSFLVAGFIEEDLAASYRFLNFFPTAYVSTNYFPSDILSEAGNSFTYKRHFLFSNEVKKSYSEEYEQQLSKKLDENLPDPTMRISFPRDANEQNAQVFRNVSDYLALVVFVCFLLSQLGSLYQIRSFLWSRKKDWSLLTLSGLKQKDWVFLVLLFGFIPSILAIIPALFCALFFLSVLPNFFPIPYMSPWQLFLVSKTIFFFLSLGLIVFQISLYLIPIYRLYHSVLIDDLLGRDSLKSIQSQGKEIALWFLSIVLGFLLVVVLTRSWVLSSMLLGSLIFLTMLVWGVGAPLLIYWQKRLNRAASIPKNLKLYFYLALRSIQFYRTMTLTFFAIFTIGVTLLMLLQILDFSITKELSVEKNDAGFFIFDVRPEDKDKVISIATQFQIPLESFAPLIRGKLISIKDQTIERKVENQAFSKKFQGLREREEEKRFLYRSINLTIRPDLSMYEKIVKGNPLPQSYRWTSPENIVPVSLEKRYAGRIGVKVGDELSFDVQGMIIKAKVENLRTVNWLGLRPNFFITLPYGVLDDAPMTYLVVSKKQDLARENEFASQMSKELKSVSTVKLSGVLEQAKRISNLLVQALTLLGLFTVGMAFFVVTSLIKERLKSAEQERKVYLLSGFSHKKIRLIFLSEIFLLVFISLLISFIASLSIGKLISLEAFDGILHVPWKSLFMVVILLLAATFGIYFRSSK